ncbi:type VI secretion system baseplate subunit TssE [Citrobacter sp. FP75]|uniref:type VI secretion system baseplate subunit TssE n=1 Tax=Citrobacter sp. FP75 TaxID=1852949 RepID=UPI001BCA3A54|nr:type VI secretion system baseplate subunit TssE [Citrobacter sp. FP75]
MVRQPSLYDVLLGNFSGGLPLQAVSENTQVVLSVLDNMQRILNTRAGSLKHLPDYGLPDMTKILQGMPGTAHQLISTLSQVLLKYEPRLKGIQVTMQEQETPGHLRYSIDAELHDLGIVRYGTDFTPEGRVLIRHLKKQGWLETGVY